MSVPGRAAYRVVRQIPGRVRSAQLFEDRAEANAFAEASRKANKPEALISVEAYIPEESGSAFAVYRTVGIA